MEQPALKSVDVSAEPGRIVLSRIKRQKKREGEARKQGEAAEKMTPIKVCGNRRVRAETEIDKV